jgi:hypothetical protein
VTDLLTTLNPRGSKSLPGSLQASGGTVHGSAMPPTKRSSGEFIGVDIELRLVEFGNDGFGGVDIIKEAEVVERPALDPVLRALRDAIADRRDVDVDDRLKAREFGEVHR